MRGLLWRLKQLLARPARYYGNGGTVHSTGHVDVEVRDGKVVAVWFRCQPLPFVQSPASEARAEDMRGMYRKVDVALTGVELVDRRRSR
jgi:hypothetical protein